MAGLRAGGRACSRQEWLECLACAAEGSSLIGVEMNLDGPKSRTSLGSGVGSTDRLIRLLPDFNLRGQVIEVGELALDAVARPAILHLLDGGYLLLGGRSGVSRSRVFRPGKGWEEEDEARVLEQVESTAVVLHPEQAANRKRSGARISAWSLFRWNREIAHSIRNAVAWSLLVQLYVVISPLYFRTVIDEVLVNDDRSLLTVIALGFGMLACFNSVAGMLRTVVFQKLANQIGWDMTQRVLGHMLRLPLNWFQSRQLADTLSRLQGLDQVRAVLIALLGAGFDACLALVSLVMLFIVAPWLLLIALPGILMLVGLRFAVIPVGLVLSHKLVLAHVAEQGKRIEIVRGIQSIKSMGRGSAQERSWLNRLHALLQATEKNASFTAMSGGAQALIGSLMGVVAIYVGALAIIEGTMTIGLLTAGLAYMGQLSQSSVNLFQQFVTWRMAGVQLDRIADIVLEQPEDVFDLDHAASSARVDGSIEATGIAFGYPSDPLPLFENLDIAIGAGEYIAITGPSGTGKSTLLKILTGLYPATAGSVRIDGRPIDLWDLSALRCKLGVVLQEDELFAGTIAQNVAFFADPIDWERVRDCISIVGLEAEILRLPLGFDATIGEMGTSLSVGQRQRLLIARALYPRPSILILDEATSNLDADSEAKIAAALAQLDITRLVVAHGPRMIDEAERVLRLEGGRIEEATM